MFKNLTELTLISSITPVSSILIDDYKMLISALEFSCLQIQLFALDYSERMEDRYLLTDR